MCLAIPGQVLSVAGPPEMPVGRVSFGGVVKEVSLAYVPEVQAGQYVIVHVGFALSILDEAEAAHVLSALEQIGGMDEAS